jgi:Rieske Fe-S protein
MRLSRREFVVLTSALACGCQQQGGGVVGGGAALVPHVVDAGALVALPLEDLTFRFRVQGFFLVRRGDRWIALSAICTHRNCKLDPAPGRSFVCRCHGSEFDPDGHVLTGPATRDLPVFATSVDGRNHLIVHVGRPA